MQETVPTTLHARSSSGRPCMAAAVLLLSACVGGSATTGSATTTVAEWRAFATPRPESLPGAARLSVAEVQLVGTLPWNSAASPLSPELGLEELVVAGLLRRRDVHFVERRRFTEAAAAERVGVARPRGAPAAGISPGAEYLATVVWIGISPTHSTLEIRLADAQTGSVASTARVSLEGEARPLPVARSIVGGLLEALDLIGRRPAWEDPIAGADGSTRAPDVSEAALDSFVDGVVAEATWDWEGARRRYQAAARDAGFFEASVALARAARLRLGGTLGES